MPGSILSTHLILTTTLGCKYFYLIFFSDEGTEEYRQLGQDYLALKLPCYTAFYFQNYLMVWFVYDKREEEQRKGRQLDNSEHN